MGLFDKFKKSKAEDNTVYSPLSGEIKPIESLQDKTFADKVMGDGVAIIPSEGKVYAPCDGEINAVLDTMHAYGLTSTNGFELLIHIGQDTVNLKGQHFSSKVKEGDKVKKGDLLGAFEMEEIIKKGYNIATPVILIAGGDFHIAEKTALTSVKAGDPLLILSK